MYLKTKAVLAAIWFTKLLTVFRYFSAQLPIFEEFGIFYVEYKTVPSYVARYTVRFNILTVWQNQYYLQFISRPFICPMTFKKRRSCARSVQFLLFWSWRGMWENITGRGGEIIRFSIQVYEIRSMTVTLDAERRHEKLFQEPVLVLK